ncbi:hypothetical protein [Neotamlana laminarinivorans]|uniref:Uncharacterized protein n=1 Tax=Neotamlana laminarinivorans TaxID=2883124 RepID=A0A9X1L1M2_9FLAO|nr:hypothetical protein [Tamlana laminarinivorans]MCB4798868.1 hypothetical protein [Tamlana laminarinivorans]
MRQTVLLFMISLLFVQCSKTDDNTAIDYPDSENDIRVGDFSVNYVNPEISPRDNYMIWIELDTINGVSGKVWQWGINPNTGDLIPEDGKGYSPFTSNIYARPADWGIDNLGVFYVGATTSGQIKMIRPTSPTSATVTDIAAPIENKRRVFYPSQLPDENKRFVLYILNDVINGFSANYPQNTKFQLRFLDLDNPTNDYLIEEQPSIYPLIVPMDVIVPRWIKGSFYITYGYKDANGVVQAKQFNALNPTAAAVPVTNDIANKVDGNTILNTLNGNQYFLSGFNATNTAYIYKRTSFESMFVQNEIITPTSVNLETPALNQSHEPFIFNNEMYSAFQINEDGNNFSQTAFNRPGEIWLTTIDNQNQQMWLLSDFDSTLNVSEPEAYIGNDKVWIFYSASKLDGSQSFINRKYQLRRCETPMN